MSPWLHALDVAAWLGMALLLAAGAIYAFVGLLEVAAGLWRRTARFREHRGEHE